MIGPLPVPVARPACRRQRDQGVTLIEIMVVLTVVAVMAGLAMSGLRTGSAQQELAGAAEKLVQRLTLAADEAMVTGRPLGLEVRQAGYGFVQWQGQAGWQPLTSGPLGLTGSLAVAMELRIYAQDGTDVADDGPWLIAPGGDAAGFRVALQLDDQRRLVLFDGLNAMQIRTDAGADDAEAI